MNMKEFKLDNEPKITSGFTTPDGYFDGFSEKMMSKIIKDEIKIVSISSSRKKWFFAVAAVLILALSVPLFNTILPTTNEPDQDTIENYITYRSEITENDLVDLLEKEDIEKMNVDYNLQNQTTEDLLLTNSNFEHYLLD